MPQSSDRIERIAESGVIDSGVAVSLSSSFRGYYAHCGFLAALSRQGIQPGRVAGSSAGAIAGLLYATGLRGDDLVDFILQKGLTRSFFDWGFLYRLPGILTFTHGTGLFTANGAVRFLKERLGSPMLESFVRPQLEISVTNLTQEVSQLLDHGDAVELAVASCAVPGLFRARPYQGSSLWDGGIAIDMPFHHWLDDPSVHTIVLHSIRHIKGSLPVPRWQSLSRGIAIGHQLVSDQLNDHRQELAELKGKRIIECVTETEHPKWSNKRRATLVKAGEAAGERAVESIIHLDSMGDLHKRVRENVPN
ncbi:MAG: NTE family protein [Verrucomicrobiales bacterium]|jgi:NTE family protein